MDFSWAAHFIAFGVILAIQCMETSESSTLAPGSCSRKCGDLDLKSADENPQNIFPFYQCSCSSSCQKYGDCCFDADYTTRGKVLEKGACLALDGRGEYLAVRKCSHDWVGSDEFCSSSIGHLPPVTSHTTGTTYSNIFCAVCNSDAENVATWNVELRCCSREVSNQQPYSLRYVYRLGQLMSATKANARAKTEFCPCKYMVHHGNYNLTDSLELRPCDPKPPAPKCSPTWSDSRVSELCESYVDPVFIGPNVYRNLHCAQCNYAVSSRASCMPSIVEQMLSLSWNKTEILKFCAASNLYSCTYYLKEISRGKGYTFSNLLNIKEKTCIPEEGKRCCADEMYDFRSKRCRKIERP